MKSELMTLLNANGVNFMHIPGGIPKVTEQDIIAALCGCDDGVWRLGLYLLCGREIERKPLLYALSVAGAGDKRIRDWVIKNKGFYHKLCALAIAEISATNTCKPCSGTGRRKLKSSKLVQCEFCNGTGRKGYSARRRARVAKIKHKDWERCKGTYGLLINILLDWEAIISRRIQRKIFTGYG